MFPLQRVGKVSCGAGCAILAALGIAAGLALSSLYFGMCGNHVISEKLSPDGQLKAVVFRRGCGAVVQDSTDVTILPANSHLPNESGNTFILRGAGSVKLVWASPRSVRIRHDPRYYVGNAEQVVHVKIGLFRRETVAVHYSAKIRY